MIYKRIIQILDTGIADGIADEAKAFGGTFREARSGGANEYVIEGALSKKRNIDNLAAAAEAMDAETAKYEAMR